MRTILPLTRKCESLRLMLLVALILLGGVAQKVQSHAELDAVPQSNCEASCRGYS